MSKRSRIKKKGCKMEIKTKDMIKTQTKESLLGIFYITIIAVIIIGVSAFTKNGTVIFFTVLAYISCLYLGIRGYLKTVDEIKDRMLIKELIKQDLTRISLAYYDSGEVVVRWVNNEELYSVTFYNSDDFPIKYKQESKKNITTDKQIEIDEDLIVTVRI